MKNKLIVSLKFLYYSHSSSRAGDFSSAFSVKLKRLTHQKRANVTKILDDAPPPRDNLLLGIYQMWVIQLTKSHWEYHFHDNKKIWNRLVHSPGRLGLTGNEKPKFWIPSKIKKKNLQNYQKNVFMTLSPTHFL